MNNHEDGEKNPSRGGNSGGGGGAGGGGATRSWGTTVSGQSVSTSGSVGSPSSRSEAAIATPASENTFARVTSLDNHADDAGSLGAAGSVLWLIFTNGICSVLNFLCVGSTVSEISSCYYLKLSNIFHDLYIFH